MTRRRARGFTLIEVVVAFAVLMLTLGALYESFGGALRRSSSARVQELATLRAASLLAEFRGSGGLLPEQREGRDEELDLSWSIVTKPYPAELSEHSSWVTEAVEVEVSWGRQRTRSVVLRSVEMLRRPP